MSGDWPKPRKRSEISLFSESSGGRAVHQGRLFRNVSSSRVRRTSPALHRMPVKTHDAEAKGFTAAVVI
jgi:hypothetical protein